MAWFKVDDGFWSHPKVIGLPPSAVALWVRAGSYSAQHFTGGEIISEVIAMLGHNELDADILVEAGLWDSNEDRLPPVYRFHDWDLYQPSASSHKARRDEISRKRAEAGRKGAKARWGQSDSKDDGKLPSGVDGNEMAPTRPDPTHISTDVDIKPEVSDETRPDVEHLLDLLDSELTNNGVKKLPKRNKTNRDAMRLLLDRDGRSVEDIEGAIRWCQSDEFWRGNILSASKLRDKYETLRAQASRGRRGPAVQDNLARLAQLEAEDRADEMKGLSA